MAGVPFLDFKYCIERKLKRELETELETEHKRDRAGESLRQRTKET